MISVITTNKGPWVAFRSREIFLQEFRQFRKHYPHQCVHVITHRFGHHARPCWRRCAAQGYTFAVDDVGAGFASMPHVLEIKPHMVKLDRDIIAGIGADAGQRALGAAMVGFATEIGAVLVAEGIETRAELTSVTRLGMTAAQGYLLGRPSAKPEDWALGATRHHMTDPPERR